MHTVSNMLNWGEIQHRVRTKEICTFKIIQNTSVTYSELHTHTSQQKNPQSQVSNDLGNCCCRAPPPNGTSFENGYPTTKKLVCSAVSKETVCNSCGMCILDTISHGTTQPDIHFFYQMLPNKTMACKGEKCAGGKKSKKDKQPCSVAILLYSYCRSFYKTKML
jgi:hypothetical protein